MAFLGCLAVEVNSRAEKQFDKELRRKDESQYSVAQVPENLRSDLPQRHFNEPAGFWLLSSCLKWDQRQLDCMADIGCGLYDNDYGSQGTHICSAAPCVGLTEEELAVVRSNNRPLCGKHETQQKKVKQSRDDYEFIV
jgi:hypothetical protein